MCECLTWDLSFFCTYWPRLCSEQLTPGSPGQSSHNLGMQFVPSITYVTHPQVLQGSPPAASRAPVAAAQLRHIWQLGHSQAQGNPSSQTSHLRNALQIQLGHKQIHHLSAGTLQQELDGLDRDPVNHTQPLLNEKQSVESHSPQTAHK
jgi:hypothetical protein